MLTQKYDISASHTYQTYFFNKNYFLAYFQNLGCRKRDLPDYTDAIYERLSRNIR
jgi:hypothetical protein